MPAAGGHPGVQERVLIYDDILEWLDMVEPLPANDGPLAMQYSLSPEVLADEAYRIDDVLVWLKAHVSGVVHCLIRDGAAGSQCTLEFENPDDSRAFAQVWGELAEDWAQSDVTGARR